MSERDSLTALILECDFTYAEMEKICGGFLGLNGETLANVLGNGGDSWQHRITDLVAWADRKGSISELTQGVLFYGGSKRAVRDWVLERENYMPGDSLPALSEAKFDKFEDRLNRRIERLEEKVAGIETTLASRSHDAQAINWSIITITILIALAIAAGTIAMAMVR